LKQRKTEGSGPKVIYVSNPKLWESAKTKAKIENKSMSEVIAMLLQAYIESE
jgi:hypothetical protein